MSMAALAEAAPLIAVLLLLPRHCRTISSTQCDGKEKAAKEATDFCYQNHFQQSDTFRTLEAVSGMAATRDVISAFMHTGQPFVVSGVTNKWPANSKWNHSFFERTFRGHDSDIFSSTFSTAAAPDISHADSVHDIYFGMFLNDRTLAELMAADYRYPEFIPEDWRETGNPFCSVLRESSRDTQHPLLIQYP